MNDNLNIASEWTLLDATITAVAERGAVYNERGVNLRIDEGRQVQLHPMGGKRPMREVWDYQFNFYLLDGKEPDNSRQDECSVAIVGKLADGRECKIHGNGYVGRDDLGQIEGSFFCPPRIELIGPEEDLVELDRPE